MRAACIQLRSGADIAANIDAASRLIREAAGQGATFIATPEMTHILQRSPNRLFEAIKPQDEDLGVKVFSALAKELSIDLLIGSLAIRTEPRRAANRSFLFDPNGALKATYDKIHLFDVTLSRTEVWKESNVYDGGRASVMADIGNSNSESAKLALSICYDLRFPHLYRSYAQAGAHIIAVPAAFTKPTGEAHWQTLLRARAIETGSFIIAPAQGGQHEDGRTTFGHSVIIGPWGEILAKLEHDKPSILLADINLSDVDEARRKIPAWNHDPDFT